MKYRHHGSLEQRETIGNLQHCIGIRNNKMPTYILRKKGNWKMVNQFIRVYGSEHGFTNLQLKYALHIVKILVFECAFSEKGGLPKL